MNWGGSDMPASPRIGRAAPALSLYWYTSEYMTDEFAAPAVAAPVAT